MAYDPPSGLSIAMQDPQTCDVLFLANPVSKEAFFFTPGTDRTIASMIPCKVPGLEDTDQYLGPPSISYENAQIHLKHLWEKTQGVSIDIVVFQYFPIFPSVNPGVDNSIIHHLEHVAKKLVHSCCFPQLTVWFLHKRSPTGFKLFGVAKSFC